MNLTITRNHLVLASRALLVLAALACIGESAYETHRTRVAIEGAVHAAPAPATSAPATHVACRAGKLAEVADHQPGDVDLPAPAPCADPADGQCLRGVPVSAAASRCAAGKL